MSESTAYLTPNSRKRAWTKATLLECQSSQWSIGAVLHGRKPKAERSVANIKRPAKYISMKKKNEKIPYVRAPGVQKKFKKERLRYGVSVQTLTSKGPFQLIQRLTKDGLLPIWKCKPSPHCSQGSLSPLKYHKAKRVWAHRCSKKGCQKLMQPHQFHPIFFSGAGSSFTPLGHQAAVLGCALAGVPVTSTPVILDMDDKWKIYQNLEVARARHALTKQKSIRFGGHHKWCDVEADEVDLGKEVWKWEQWGGIVERGNPKTLCLYRLSPKLTKARSPGPGPIRRADWKPIAKRMLQGRNIILHTDGARTYKFKVQGVLHGNVVRKKKKVTVKGKTAWVKPHYTRICSHTLPDGDTVKVVVGTQIIDRFWQDVRTYLKTAQRKVGSVVLNRKIRAAQWTYLAQMPELVEGYSRHAGWSLCLGLETFV